MGRGAHRVLSACVGIFRQSEDTCMTVISNTLLLSRNQADEPMCELCLRLYLSARSRAALSVSSHWRLATRLELKPCSTITGTDHQPKRAFPAKYSFTDMCAMFSFPDNHTLDFEIFRQDTPLPMVHLDGIPQRIVVVFMTDSQSEGMVNKKGFRHLDRSFEYPP